jgi:hypothetical protein
LIRACGNDAKDIFRGEEKVHKNLTQKEMRSGKIAMLPELFFVFLPLLIMILVSHLKNDLKSSLASPEWSLAATILFGQSALRFYSGINKVIKQKGESKSEWVVFWSGLIFVLALLSATIYGLRLGYEDYFLSFLQIPIFLLAVLLFVVFGGIGQIYLDRN